jgi:uncharacterized protein (DUF488 family)
MSESTVRMIVTIGYGSRTIEEFVGLLKKHGVECLVDVRTAPYSRFKPEFSREALAATVEAAGIRYLFGGQELGGRPDAPECYVDGKVDYDRVRTTVFYARGIERIQQAHHRGTKLVLMCSELRPEECHRSKLIGVTLAEMGIPILHIDEEGVLRTQDEVIARLTGRQLDLFGEPSFTSRKSNGTET